MWAAGALSLFDPLRIGDMVERRSTIIDVAPKIGRSGDLCFVTLDHQLSTARGTAIQERQTIVYRGHSQQPPQQTIDATSKPEWHRVVPMDPARLFRYSAITFNAHRIHYDLSYAREFEGYRGLVVHGPLQATLLLQFAAQQGPGMPRSFEFRAMGPLIESGSAALNAAPIKDGMSLWITDNELVTTRADARW
jgi:3-methylfumaryl-CoA hydratase